MNTYSPLLFSGSSHETLAHHIASQLAIPLGRIALNKFPDGEIKVEIQENVKGRHVFILQSTGLHPSEYLMELLLIIDALKRSAAKSITAVIPYFAYSRQDRKDKPGVPITAKLIANLLSASGLTRLITMDLHSSQIEGFFEIPVDHLKGHGLLAAAITRQMRDNFIVVAPDVGSIKFAKKVANLLHAEFVVIEKQRISSHKVKMNLIGNLSKNQVVIIDDMCSTAGTLVAAASLCKELGAKQISAAITHGIFSEDALGKIEKSPIECLLVTDTLPPFDRYASSPKIEVVTIAPTIAQAIQEWVGI